MLLLVNHLGYESHGAKFAVVNLDNTEETLPSLVFSIVDEANNSVFSGELSAFGEVDNWQKGVFYQAQFDSVKLQGWYRLKIGETLSHLFRIKDNNYQPLITPVLNYINHNRCQGANNEKDKHAKFIGEREGSVDVSGGWYDASGDWSKYLSHLSYANYMNPQQIPMVAWSMLELAESQPNNSEALDEALFGADYLTRIQDEAGYFYMTVFDKWSKVAESREICAYETQKGHKTDMYQAAFRQGAGMSIAALARASRLPIGASESNQENEFSGRDYLVAAVKGFEHLLAHNTDYCDDGKENIIDDYCALMAAVELYRCTQESSYKQHAQLRVDNLLNRLSSDANFSGWFRADDEGERPFSHAAEEGLPILALMHFYQYIEKNETVKTAIDQVFAFWFEISEKVANPFSYVRHYVKPVNSEKTDQFFFTHDNESGYWWQGENARLGSIATVCFKYQSVFSEDKKIHSLGYQQLNWMMGVNPFDACMIEGYGRNNPEYRDDWPGHTGAVCNGITSGLTDESAIALCESDDDEQSWRWGEQWLPHGAWWIMALLAENKR
jgi:hypothetical protein